MFKRVYDISLDQGSIEGVLFYRGTISGLLVLLLRLCFEIISTTQLVIVFVSTLIYIYIENCPLIGFLMLYGVLSRVGQGSRQRVT